MRNWLSVSPAVVRIWTDANRWDAVFEDESLAEKAVVAVEKTIHHESIDDHPVGEPKMDVGHIEVEAMPKEM